MYRIGTDVGGTNTDAAIIDTHGYSSQSSGFVASYKTPTTPDVTSGIYNAVENVLRKSDIDRRRVFNVAIGSTHFINAVVQSDSQRLSRVAVIRLCGPYTKQIPPFSDFPSTPEEIIAGPVFYLDGGLEVDGDEIAPLNPEDIKCGCHINQGCRNQSCGFSGDLQGVSQCLSPPHHDSANAVGAAIAKAAGEVDIIEVLADRDERSVIEKAKEQAIAVAVAKGADEADVKVVELEKIPLQYVTNKATRIKAKAVGRLGLKREVTHTSAYPAELNDNIGTKENGNADWDASQQLKPEARFLAKPSMGLDISMYRPNVKEGVWGGASSYEAALHALDILRNGGAGKMRVVSPASLKDSDLCVCGAGYGAPSFSNERSRSGMEIFNAIEGLNRLFDISDFQAVVSDEMEGGNGLAMFPSSVRYDRPVFDADMMGRAYPTMEHGTPYVYGEPITRCAMANGKGNVSVVVSTESNKKVERMLRTTCIELGNSAAVAARPLSGRAIK